jgi:hypothetical protein
MARPTASWEPSGRGVKDVPPAKGPWVEVVGRWYLRRGRRRKVVS